MMTIRMCERANQECVHQIGSYSPLTPLAPGLPLFRDTINRDTSMAPKIPRNRQPASSVSSSGTLSISAC